MSEELKVVISADTSQFQKNVESAKKEIENFTKKSKVSFGEINTEFQKYGDACKKGLGIAAGAIAGAATALLALSGTTEEYRNQQAMLTTAFETAGATAEVAKNTYNDLYRVLGDSGQAVEAAQHLAALTNEEAALAEYTTICQGVFATFGESLPLEGLTEAINHTTNLGEVQGVLADALEWSGISVDTFNAQLAACNTEAEREALIRNTLNGIYGEAAANYENTNAKILAQNDANRKMTDALAALGDAMAPINTMLTELGAEILADLTPYIQDFAAKYLPKIKEVLADVGEKIGIAITWIADNWEFLTTLGGILLGVATAISVISTVMSVVNAVMAASPVTWIVLGIVAAVAALTAAIILCVKNWDKIKQTVSNVCSAIGNTVSNIFNGIKTTISNVMEGAKTVVKNCIDKIKGFFKFDWSLPKLKMPHISITGKFSLSPLQVPKFGISWYQKGGVFDNTTLFGYGNGLIGGLGENGAEAVVPLEKNTQWLDRIANMLVEKQGGNQPIYLTVDGKVFAQLACDSINSLTKQRGSIPLKLY